MELFQLILSEEEFNLDRELSQDSPLNGKENCPAEVKVSEHLRNKPKERLSLQSSRLSRKVGTCLFLASLGYENPRDRLNWYQEWIPEEAILAAIRIYQRLVTDPKFRSESKHLFSYFIFEKKVRKRRKIRKPQFVRGYRDHGTLPDLNFLARKDADRMNFLDLRSLEPQKRELLEIELPRELFEGDNLDLTRTKEFLQEEELILRKLKMILRNS